MTDTIDPQKLEDFWHELNTRVEAASRDRQAHRTGPGSVATPSKLFTEDDRQALRDYLASPDLAPPKRSPHMSMFAVMEGLKSLASSGALSPGAAMKMLLFFETAKESSQFLTRRQHELFELLHATTGRPALLELSELLRRAGISADALLLAFCSASQDATGRTWPDADLWPYFVSQTDVLMRMLVTPKGYTVLEERSSPDGCTVLHVGRNRPAVYRAIGMIPSKSAAMIDALVAVALGTSASERAFAQDVLRDVPEIEPRITTALSHGRAKVRAAATEWQARRACAQNN